MKKLGFILSFIFISVIILSGCTNNNDVEGDLLRLHIRANSDSCADQSVKLLVKERVVEYLDGMLINETELSRAMDRVTGSLSAIEAVANKVLQENGFTYRASARLTQEYFPTRAYEDIVVESGVYDALIVELGSGEGQNWWCVIYPPLCFVGRDNYGSEFSYKSKLVEIWRRYFSS